MFVIDDLRYLSTHLTSLYAVPFSRQTCNPLDSNQLQQVAWGVIYTAVTLTVYYRLHGSKLDPCLWAGLCLNLGLRLLKESNF